MPTEDERPPVIESPTNPDVECVRIDAQAPSGEPAPPPGPAPSEAGDEPLDLCPEGYVPRLRRRRDYTLDGKVIVTDTPPSRNPDEPPED